VRGGWRCATLRGDRAAAGYFHSGPYIHRPAKKAEKDRPTQDQDLLSNRPLLTRELGDIEFYCRGDERQFSGGTGGNLRDLISANTTPPFFSSRIDGSKDSLGKKTEKARKMLL